MRTPPPHTTAGILIASLAIALLGVALDARETRAQVSAVGRWIGPFDWDGNPGDRCETAIHTAVLRGRGDSTVILHFAFGKPDPGRCPTAKPRVLVIPPNTLVTAANFAQFGQAVCPAPEAAPDLFCSGHAGLADGRVVIVGGTTEGINGHKQVLLFDPRHYSDASFVDPALDDTLYWGWALLESDTMKYERYYPTAVQLADNRVLVSSGLEYLPMIVFGGQQPGLDAVDSLHTLGLTLPGKWTRYVYRGNPAESSRGPVRRDFVMGYGAPAMYNGDLSGTVVMFGGHNGTSALDDLRVAWRTAWNEDDSWSWYTPQRSPVTPWPAARSEHAGVVVGPGPEGLQSCTMWVYGGRDGSGNALGDLWKLHFSVRAGGDAGNDVAWAEPVTAAGAQQPGPRFGHTAVYDEYKVSPTVTQRRMLVYGGKTGANAWADNAVYALDLDASPPTWSVVTPASGSRVRRYRHAAIMDEFRANDAQADRRMMVFGGVSEGGTLLGDVEKFTRPFNSLASYVAAPATPATGPQPAARYRHTAIADRQWNRMVVFGGDTTGTGGYSNSVWTYPLDRLAGQSGHPVLEWTRLQPANVSDLPGKAGHAAVYYPIEVNARVAEVLDVSQPRGQRWSELPSLRYYTRESYPFVTNLPSGNVLYAGRNIRSIPNTGGPTNAMGTRVVSATGQGALLGDALPSFVPGTSAVMYDTMNVIKFGKAPADAQDYARVARFTAAGSLGAWAEVPASPLDEFRPEPRVEPNMTMLPDGRVFVSGGREDHQDDTPAFKFPQILNPISGTWTTREEQNPLRLPDDPSTRGYHSTALLLPDGRVLSAGGHDTPSSSQERDQYDVVTLYEPAYLFKDGAGNASARPAFTLAPDSIGYGYSFEIACSVPRATVTKVALVRPGFTTHAFNQDHRYIPLAFDSVGVPAPKLRVKGLSSAKIASPGDYLLFVLATTDAPSGPVPSTGKWVRVDDLLPGPVTTLTAQEPMCIPGGVNLVTLNWTAVADDAALAASGPATQYKLRKADSPLREQDFLTKGSGVITGTPGAPGVTESAQVEAFTANQLWYARLKVKDTGRWSILSNEVSFYCDDGPGGGGDGCPPDCPHGSTIREAGATIALPALSPSIAGIAAGNSVLDGGEPGAETMDHLPLPALVPDDSGHVAVWLQAGRTVGLDVNAVTLLVVDHPADQQAFVDGTGAVHAGEPAPLLSAILNGSEDLAGAFAAGTTRRFEAGDVLDVRLAGTGARAIRLEGRRLAPLSDAASGVEVLAEGGGGWQSLGHWLPRRRLAAHAVAADTASHLRLSFVTKTEVTGLATLVLGDAPAVQTGTLLSALSAAQGDQFAAVAGVDANAAALVDGDSLVLSFDAPPADTTRVRAWYLRVSGRRTATLPSGTSARATPEPGAGLGHSLYANVPNPFRDGTEFRFRIPVRQRVSLEVFDLGGRRVRRWASEYAPGTHAITWDRRTERGERVAAGIYFYRMSASRFRDQKRLIVFP